MGQQGRTRGANSKAGKDPTPPRKLIKKEPQRKKEASKKIALKKKKYHPSLRNITVGQQHWASGGTKSNILLRLHFCERVSFNRTHLWHKHFQGPDWISQMNKAKPARFTHKTRRLKTKIASWVSKHANRNRDKKTVTHHRAYFSQICFSLIIVTVLVNNAC